MAGRIRKDRGGVSHWHGLSSFDEGKYKISQRFEGVKFPKELAHPNLGHLT
jgi:hypothetical protein